MVKEGLQISKEYFLDLFGRYIKYLIITDLIWLSIGILMMLIGLVFLGRGVYLAKEDNWHSDGMLHITIGTILAVIGLMISTTQTFDLAKAYTIPEIRIYEEIKLLTPRN